MSSSELLGQEELQVPCYKNCHDILSEIQVMLSVMAEHLKIILGSIILLKKDVTVKTALLNLFDNDFDNMENFYNDAEEDDDD